jgi:hypothetical protein
MAKANVTDVAEATWPHETFGDLVQPYLDLKKRLKA